MFFFPAVFECTTISHFSGTGCQTASSHRAGVLQKKDKKRKRNIRLPFASELMKAFRTKTKTNCCINQLETVELCKNNTEFHLFNITAVQLHTTNVYPWNTCRLEAVNTDSLSALTNCSTTRTGWKSMFSRMRASGCWSTGAERVTGLPGGASLMDLSRRL